jgi:hypothetical protein
MKKRILLETINNEIVSPIPMMGGEKPDNRPIKGANLFPEIYSNIFICSKKKTGKTSVIFKILKECSTKDTNIIVFCSTLHKDQSYKNIRKYFEARGNNFIGYTSFKEDGQDQLFELVKHLQDKAEKDDEEEEKEVPKIKPENLLNFGEPEEEDKPKKKRKEKYRSPEYIIVCDDISGELRNPALESLLKANRHYKMKVIVASQWANDLLPSQIKQMDYILLFRSHSIEKLQKLYKDADLSVPFSAFYKMYKTATSAPFGFLYIDTNNEEFRTNFNRKFFLPDFE